MTKAMPIKSDLRKTLRESLNRATPEAAVAAIMMEGLSRGTKVAVLDDPIYGMNGLIGTVEGSEATNDGFVNVRFESGTVVPLQATLLCPV